MAGTYYKELDKSSRLKIKEILESLPPYAEDFYRSLMASSSPLTQVEYLQDLKRFLSYLCIRKGIETDKLAMFPLEDVISATVDDLNAYKEWLIDGDGEEFPSNGPYGVRRKLASLSAFYDYLDDTGKITGNPVHKVKRPKVMTKTISYLSHNEVDTLIRGIESCEYWIRRDRENERFVKLKTEASYRKQHSKFILRDIALIVLAVCTGLRVGEVVSLDVSDIHLDDDNPYLRVQRSKGNSEQRIPFSEDVYEALDDYIYGVPSELYEKYPTRIPQYVEYIQNAIDQEWTDIPIRCAKAFQIETDDFVRDMTRLERRLRYGGRQDLRKNKYPGETALFLNKNGKRLSKNAANKIIGDAVQCYLPNRTDVTFHVLRKTFATNMLRQTQNVALVAKMLNHKSTDTTAKFYADIMDDQIVDAMKNVRK